MVHITSRRKISRLTDGYITYPFLSELRKPRRLLVILSLIIAILSCWRFIVQWEMFRQCPEDYSYMKRPSVQASEPSDLCFITCIFGNSLDEVDQPSNVEWFRDHWCPTARFDLVTNLPGLEAPGWSVHLQETSSDKYPNIVQSREAKFLAWKALPFVESQCKVVFYMDGYMKPQYSYISSTLAKFERLAEEVQTSQWGLAQVQQSYFNGLTFPEIFNKTIVAKGKDTSDNAVATLQWLKQQPDYQDKMTYYLNKYFAYDPNNAKYRELSSWFWNTYTTYGGSWRDQPLWAYAMHHFQVEPLTMTRDRKITRGGDLFWTGGRVGWNNHVHVP